MNEKYLELILRSLTTCGSFFIGIWGAVNVIKSIQESKAKVAKEKSVGEEAVKEIKQELEEIKKKISEHKEDQIRRIDKLHDSFNEVVMRVSKFLSK